METPSQKKEHFVRFYDFWSILAIFSFLLLRVCVGLTPPSKTLPSGQIIISYVKLFLNNNKKPQMDGLIRIPNLLGGVNPTHIRGSHFA